MCRGAERSEAERRMLNDLLSGSLKGARFCVCKKSDTLNCPLELLVRTFFCNRSQALPNTKKSQKIPLMTHIEHLS